MAMNIMALSRIGHGSLYHNGSCHGFIPPFQVCGVLVLDWHPYIRYLYVLYLYILYLYVW